MNAFVKKEIRLVLPNFAIACALSLANLMLRDPAQGAFAGLTNFMALLLCPAAVIMLALSPFGGEVGAGTLAGLLAQPISRQRIWDTKVALLITTLLGVGLVWMATFGIHNMLTGQRTNNREMFDVFVAVILFGLAIFSGGLWTPLLLRQVASAFWITLLAPSALMVLIAAFLSGGDDDFMEGMIVVVLGLYSLGGFFFARWLFFRAQDLQWSGGNIEMPELRDLAWFRVGTRTARGWHPRAALWRKEIMLQQSQMVMAFVLAVLHVGVILARNFMDMQRHRDLEFILSIFWGLWLVMPLLVGCAAVAEERKLGTLEEQLCLPARHRTQFYIKLTVVLGLSLLFGLVVPTLFEGERIMPGGHLHLIAPPTFAWDHMSWLEKLVWFGAAFVHGFAPLLLLVFIALSIGLIAFLASSLARNTLQTLGPAVLGVMGTWGLVGGATIQWNTTFKFLWQGPLPFIVGIPLLGGTILWLALGNFKHARPGFRLVGYNLLVLVVAVLATGVLSSALYHRCWEKLMPFEPRHGAARLARDGTTKLVNEYEELLVTLPDGKRLISGLGLAADTDNPVSLMLGNQRMQSSYWKILGGTNWQSLQHSYFDIAGIKPDGTLWVALQKKGQGDNTTELTQVGSETNWSSLAGFNYGMLLVKTDGTLWFWGVDDYRSDKTQWPGLAHCTPRRLGTGSDWAEVKQMGSRPWLVTKDGGYYSTDIWGELPQPGMEIDSNLTVYPVPDVNRNEPLQLPNMVTLWFMSSERLQVGSDGAFRIVAREQPQRGPNSRSYNWAWVPANVPIGQETNWLAVAGGGDKVVTLKQDGTLWLWDFHPRFYVGGSWRYPTESEIQNTVPVQLGSHTDWIAITRYSDESIVALAADGSLWYWRFAPNKPHPVNPGETDYFTPILDVSHKPQLIGNVFALQE